MATARTETGSLRAGNSSQPAERVNERFARVEQVKRFAVLERDLSQETGELKKAKRAVVYSKYRDVIDSLYE
jgi:long-chain acyl-CoA synthetase